MDAIIGDLQQAQERVLKSARTTLEEAKKCGDLLLEAKEQVSHGEWEAWLARNFKGNNDVARRYMKIAQNFDDGKIDLGSVSNVSEAVKELAKPKPTETTARRVEGTGPDQEDTTEHVSGVGEVDTETGEVESEDDGEKPARNQPARDVSSAARGPDRPYAEYVLIDPADPDWTAASLEAVFDTDEVKAIGRSIQAL